jgi:membrane protease YdiL (CAAX protease family)
MLSRVGVFYVLVWLCLMLLGGIQQETGLLPPEIGLPQWAPGIAGLLMLAIFRKDGHKMIWLSKETPLLRYLLAAVIPVGLGLVTFLIISLLGIESSSSGAAFSSFSLVVLWAPLGALGEEIGWRGYLHKYLDARVRGVVSSLIVGVLWAPFHVHFLSEGLVFMLFFVLLLISYSIVLFALIQDTGFNILLATLFHLSINYINLIFLDVIYSTTFTAINAVVWAIAAVTLVLRRKEIYLAPKPSS